MDLFVKGVSTLSIFAHNCTKCGELNVDGFWQQLDKRYDRQRRLVFVTMHCRKCANEQQRKFRLTTGRPLRHRLMPWIDWGWQVLPWIPTWMARHVIGLILWLETRVPL